METLDLRFLVAVVLRSDPSLFARLRVHAAKVLQQLTVEVFAVTAKDPFESFPARREHFLTLVDWLECSTPSLYGQSLQTVCASLGDPNMPFESKAVVLSIMLPAVLALPLQVSVLSAPIAPLKTDRCVSPMILVKARSTPLLHLGANSGASTAVVVSESFAVLRDIGSGKLPAVPFAIAGTTGIVTPSSSWWNNVTWTDICEIASTFGTAARLGTREAELQRVDVKQLDEETRKFVTLQLQAFAEPRVQLPRDDMGRQVQTETLAQAQAFEPWAGPFSPDRLSNSLWRNKTTGEIVSHADMVRSILDGAPLMGGLHFAPALVSDTDMSVLLGGGGGQSLQGGALHGGSATDAILNRVLGDDKTLPKTFSIVPDGRMFQPWSGGETLDSVSFASAQLTEEQVKGILFQIVWTLAVLQREFEGFQHNSLARSIRLVRFGKTRCFRVSGSGQGFTFCIPASVPLPVITHFATANALSEPLPVRASGSFDDQTDLVSVLDVMTKHTFGVEAFAVAHELRKVCASNCNPARLVVESAIDKQATVTQGNRQVTLQSLMFVDAFDVFVSRSGPSSSALAQVETL